MRSIWPCLFLIACGGDDGGTAFEGIYRVATWNENGADCADEGPARTPTAPMFYVKNESFFGESFINVKDCDDVATCSDLANDADTLHIGEFFFEEGSDRDSWTSESLFAFDVDGQCDGTRVESTLQIDDMGFRIEERSFDLVPFPADTGDEPCPETKLATAAIVACTRRQAITATFEQGY